MGRKISTERKGAYYLGTFLIVVGFLLFVSVFVTGLSSSGAHPSVESGFGSGPARALLGMGLVLVGGIVRGVGARGLAGSGVVLDPERARRDLEPYSRMAGGMLGDALEEADVDLGRERRGDRVVMIKCRRCGKLNEDGSKYCQECGDPI